MKESIMTSYKPKRSVYDENILNQYSDVQTCEVLDHPFICKLLNSIKEITLILNTERKIVYSNNSFTSFIGVENDDLAYALRQDSVDVFETGEEGYNILCCSKCGAIKANPPNQKDNENIHESDLGQNVKSRVFDFQIWIAHLNIDKEKFHIYVLIEINDVKRRKEINRIFQNIFHNSEDIKGPTDWLKEANTDEIYGFNRIANEFSDMLKGKISKHMDIKAAENNKINIKARRFNSLGLFIEIIKIFQYQEIAKNRMLQIDFNADYGIFISDKSLLRRVIYNMVKNALEASHKGDTITLGCNVKGKEIELWVNSPEYMPENAQSRVFQKPLLREDNSNALGTYYMKLITEKYLNGKMSYETSNKLGTTFKAIYPSIL